MVAFIREEEVDYGTKQVDQDGLWKKVIGELFEDFLLFFSPALHAEVDFSVEIDFLQQELFEEIVLDKSGRRFTDQLVKVQLKGGEEKWILVHVEVQGNHPSSFSKRMFQYFYRIYDRFNKDVVTFAIMTSPHHSKKLGEFHYDTFGTKLFFTYNECKRVNYNYSELEQSNKLFSKIVLAAKYRYDTQDDAEKRYTFKEKLLRELMKDNRYSNKEIQAAVYFIDYLLRLPEELKNKLHEEMIAIIQEEGYGMVHQYNSGEWPPVMEAVFASIREKAEQAGVEQGIEQGIERGTKQGVKKVALQMLKKGTPTDFIAEVTQLEEVEIEKLRETL